VQQKQNIGYTVIYKVPVEYISPSLEDIIHILIII